MGAPLGQTYVIRLGFKPNLIQYGSVCMCVSLYVTQLVRFVYESMDSRFYSVQTSLRGVRSDVFGIFRNLKFLAFGRHFWSKFAPKFKFSQSRGGGFTSGRA